MEKFALKRHHPKRKPFPSENQLVNFSSLVFTKNRKRLSVIGRYDPSGIGLPSFRFLDAAGREREDDEAYYLGLSPKFDRRLLVEAILSYGEKKNDLAAVLHDGSPYFAFPHRKDSLDPAPYVFPLFAFTVVRMAYHYGVAISVKKEMLPSLKEVLKRFPDGDLTCALKEGEEPSMQLRGFPDFSLLEGLDRRFGLRHEKEKGWTLLEKQEGLTPFSKLYAQENVISLLDKQYYSGIIPSLEHIKDTATPYNEDNQIAILSFSRTSFAYEDALDNPRTILHPALAPYRKTIREFFDYEARLEQETVFASAETEKEYLKRINRYLSRSYYHKSIGVSSNLLTGDGYLVFSLRRKNIADANSLYCSVNGHAEINDPNVDFYHESVYEDLPTINLDSPRIDFEHEIQREATAELSLSLDPNQYIYYGMAVLGIKRSVEEQIQDKRPYSHRLQFNILSSHLCHESYEEVAKRQSNATEAFENEKLLGLRILTKEARRNAARRFFKFGQSNVEVTFSLVAAILAVMGATTAFSILDSIWKIAVAALSILAGVYSLFALLRRALRLRRDTITIRLAKRKRQKDGGAEDATEAAFASAQDKLLKKIGKGGKKASVNPIADVLLYLYLWYQR